MIYVRVMNMSIAFIYIIYTFLYSSRKYGENWQY